MSKYYDSSEKGLQISNLFGELVKSHSKKRKRATIKKLISLGVRKQEIDRRLENK
jgi:hypothetical protein